MMRYNACVDWLLGIGGLKDDQHISGTVEGVTAASVYGLHKQVFLGYKDKPYTF